jgi:hypothetical protein
VTVSLQVRKSQLTELDQLADAAHTSRAALVREAIDRLLTRLKRLLIRQKQRAAHGRRSIDTDLRVPPESGEPSASAPCALTRRRLAAAFGSPQAR